MSLGRPQSLSGLVGEEKQLMSLPGIEPRILFFSARIVVTLLSTDCAVRAVTAVR
jgi:hypothetical protein